MANVGRPKADIKKDKVVSIRMKPEEYSRLKEYADASQKTVSEVVLLGVEKIISDKR